MAGKGRGVAQETRPNRTESAGREFSGVAG